MFIYSKVKPDVLLHGIFSKSDWDDLSSPRRDLSNPNEFLQIATIDIPAGKQFLAHRHIFHKIDHTEMIAQESWVVVEGQVEVSYFDLDDTLLSMHILSAGELSYTFFGGHSYKGVSERSKVFEFKSGPYLGQEKDKVFI
jgi:hypothetical protein